MAWIELESGDTAEIRLAFETAFSTVSLHNFIDSDFKSVAKEVSWFGINIGLAAVVSQVVAESNRQGLLDQMLVSALARFPYRADLKALVLQLSRRAGWSASLGAHGLDVEKALSTLERLTSPGQPFVSARRMARWVLSIERQVCQIECGADAGTGFLVGPDLVLTCFHVVRRRINDPDTETRLRFDYHEGLRGDLVAGEWIGLDSEWRIESSPFSSADISLDGEPGKDELDYALLKIDTSAGHEEVSEGIRRGWVDLSGDLPLPEPAAPILIVQHPGNPTPPPRQLPLQLSFATPGFERVNAEATRVVYKPSTLPGSSGSPVFDGKLAPVALHHNRGQIDPNAVDLTKNNRGIPLATIKAHLSEQTRALLIPVA